MGSPNYKEEPMDREGETPLHKAAKFGRLNVVQFMMPHSNLKEKQLKEKDLEIIGRENQLTIQNNKLESEQRKFIIEKDITITQLEVERQNIRVSNHVIPYGILRLLRN